MRSQFLMAMLEGNWICYSPVDEHGWKCCQVLIGKYIFPNGSGWVFFLLSCSVWGGRIYTSWWFQICFIFTPIWGRFPFWLIFFKGVGSTTNQKSKGPPFCFLPRFGSLQVFVRTYRSWWRAWRPKSATAPWKVKYPRWWSFEGAERGFWWVFCLGGFGWKHGFYLMAVLLMESQWG